MNRTQRNRYKNANERGTKTTYPVPDFRKDRTLQDELSDEAQVARTYDINGFGPISVSPAEMVAAFRRITNPQFAAQSRGINANLDRIARARAAGYQGPLTRQEAAIQALGR